MLTLLQAITPYCSNNPCNFAQLVFDTLWVVIGDATLMGVIVLLFFMTLFFFGRVPFSAVLALSLPLLHILSDVFHGVFTGALVFGYMSVAVVIGLGILSFRK